MTIFVWRYDYSKETKSLIPSITGLGHIFIGVIIGLLVMPIKYSFEKNKNLDDKSCQEYYKNIVFWRQIVGISIYLTFTVRNYLKHTKNLKNNIYNCPDFTPNLVEKCNLDNIISLTSKSSSTKQQLQLYFGMCIPILIALIFSKDYKNNISENPSQVYNALIYLFIAQIFIQVLGTFLYHKDKPRNIFRKYYAK